MREAWSIVWFVRPLQCYDDGRVSIFSRLHSHRRLLHTILFWLCSFLKLYHLNKRKEVNSNWSQLFLWLKYLNKTTFICYIKKDQRKNMATLPEEIEIKPKHNKIPKISFHILIHALAFFISHCTSLTANLLTNISIAYLNGGDASKAQHTSAHVRDHCRPPAHLLYWLQPARRPAGPKSLLVAFYGCINKSDKSLMLGPFMAFQPDCLIA